jgi:peptidase M28-like protein
MHLSIVMKKIKSTLGLLFLVNPFLLPAFCQPFEDSIEEKEASTILRFLSSDDLKGRRNFTPELITAAKFIGQKFDECGLQPFPGTFSFYQPFSGADAKSINRERVKWNGKDIDQSRFFYFTSDIFPKPKILTDFNVIQIEGAFTDSIILSHWLDTTNTLIWWKQLSTTKQKLPTQAIRHPDFPPTKDILVVSDAASPHSLLVKTNDSYKKNVLFNVVGVLQGKTKPKELVIFSAHYDHVGELNGGICNGANDDASGTTALLMLAKYFAARNDNQRTILFCAFAGEELGLYGSYYLASILKPEYVSALINIEMIGKTNINGKNSFCVTGAEYSSLSQILKTNLRNNFVKPIAVCNERNLFERSDNFPFALRGVPAHTVMCSDDGDPCYHMPCDDFKLIDIANMTTIIKAIAVASQSIIDARDTPSRINTSQMQ